MRIDGWDIIIEGFTQESGTLNGMVHVWSDLIEATKCREAWRVELLRWNDKVWNQAELIKRIAQFSGVKPIINVYAYSWGGQTAANFARELRRRGLTVNRMVLTDAVYRHTGIVGNLGNWRVLATWFPIVIPDNVNRVSWFRQYECFPRGHDLVCSKPGVIDKPVVVTLDHKWMDDLGEFRDLCREVCLESMSAGNR